jgi:tyrosine-specific transport protein
MFKKSGEVKEYKGFFSRHRLAIAVTTLMGTIIGAGILGIPYVVAKTGFIYGFILIVAIGMAFLYLNLFLGEIVLRTQERHQLPGYAQRYLGENGKKFVALTMLVALYGALTAYLIGEGSTLQAIFKIGPAWMYTFFFFAAAFFVIYKGVKATGKAELFLILTLFVVIVAIGTVSLRQIRLERLLTANIGNIFLPYGIILFSFIGSSAIPELREELGREREKMKKAIIIGSVLPIIIYLVFTAIIVGIVGVEQFELLAPNERIATIALSVYTQPFLGILANFLAVLTMLTSFLALGIALVHIYRFDYSLTHLTATSLALLPPLVISVLPLTTFLSVLGMTGALAGGLHGIMVVVMYWKAKTKGNRTPEYSLPRHTLLGWILILMFSLGVLYQIKISLW